MERGSAPPSKTAFKASCTPPTKPATISTIQDRDRRGFSLPQSPMPSWRAHGEALPRVGKKLTSKSWSSTIFLPLAVDLGTRQKLILIQTEYCLRKMTEGTPHTCPSALHIPIESTEKHARPERETSILRTTASQASLFLRTCQLACTTRRHRLPWLLGF